MKSHLDTLDYDYDDSHDYYDGNTDNDNFNPWDYVGNNPSNSNRDLLKTNDSEEEN